jgi:hypothetical protein
MDRLRILSVETGRRGDWETGRLEDISFTLVGERSRTVPFTPKT